METNNLWQSFTLMRTQTQNKPLVFVLFWPVIISYYTSYYHLIPVIAFRRESEVFVGICGLRIEDHSRMTIERKSLQSSTFSHTGIFPRRILASSAHRCSIYLMQKLLLRARTDPNEHQRQSSSRSDLWKKTNWTCRLHVSVNAWHMELRLVAWCLHLNYDGRWVLS